MRGVYSRKGGGGVLHWMRFFKVGLFLGGGDLFGDWEWNSPSSRKDSEPHKGLVKNKGPTKLFLPIFSGEDCMVLKPLAESV